MDHEHANDFLRRLAPARLTAWDVMLSVRAALAGAAALVLVTLITAASDEGGVRWAERFGRALPLAPLCGALGAWAALAPVLVRGERLALESLGLRPSRVGAPAALGAFGLSASAALLIAATPSVDVTGFYPTATRATEWRWIEASTSFEDVTHGLRVGVDGTPVHLLDGSAGSTCVAHLRLPLHARAVAAAVTAAAGLGLALLAASSTLARSLHEGSERRAFLQGPLVWIGAAGAAMLTAGLFQAAAAGQLPAVAALAPTASLLGLAVVRYRSTK